MDFDISDALLVFQKKYTPSVYRRAFSYLYTKETKSSFEIEREKPNQNKMERFVTLLTKAGVENDNIFLSEKSLTDKQNKIVDTRFIAYGWRDFQNYIGETLPDYSQHDILVRRKAVSSGTIIPISAQMLENIEVYDGVLEAYSKPLLSFIKFSLDTQGELTIQNPSEILSYFKYPNLTRQCKYIFNTLVAAIIKIEDELEYLNKYDTLKNEIANYLDLPDKLLNNLIIFIHQNKGILSKNKRKQFEKLTDDEIDMVEKLYNKIF